jgi:hypothetical protein
MKKIRDFSISLIILFLLFEYESDVLEGISLIYKLVQLFFIVAIILGIVWSFMYIYSTFSLGIWTGLNKFIADIKTNYKIFVKIIITIFILIFFSFLKSCSEALSNSCIDSILPFCDVFLGNYSGWKWSLP